MVVDVVAYCNSLKRDLIQTVTHTLKLGSICDRHCLGLVLNSDNYCLDLVSKCDPRTYHPSNCFESSAWVTTIVDLKSWHISHELWVFYLLYQSQLELR